MRTSVSYGSICADPSDVLARVGALLEEEGMALCRLARKVEQVAEEGIALIPVNVLRSLRFSTN